MTDTDLTLARAEGRDEAIALATRAICPRCRNAATWAPAAWSPTEGWEHTALDPAWAEAANDCRAHAIWEAIKVEGWI